MTMLRRGAFQPDPAATAVYEELYGLYRELHDGFGGVRGAQADIPTLMKRLLAIRERAVAPARSGRDRARMIAPELREVVCRANQALAGTGLVLGTFGNVSGADARRRRVRDQAKRRAVRRS